MSRGLGDVYKRQVLDTATGSGAEQFYARCGWEKVGEIPRYALMPDGKMTATSLFYKFLP